MEESITNDVVVDAPVLDNASEPTVIEGGSEPVIVADPEATTTIPDAGEIVDEVPDKFKTETGEIDAQKVLASYKALEKMNSTNADKAKQAKQLEAETGLSLAEVLDELASPSTQTVTPVDEDTNGVDVQLFNELADKRMEEKWGPQFQKLAKIERQEAQDALAKKYPDFHEYDTEMGKVLKENPKLTLEKNFGLETAYFAAKGRSLDAKVTAAKEEGANSALNKVANKNAAAVEPTTYGTPTAEKAITAEELTAHINAGDTEWLAKNMPEINRQEKAGLIK